MRPLTDETPKPLLKVGGKPLILHLVERIVAAGYCDLVINLAWQGDKIAARLGDGAQHGARIVYSDEGKAALETAGGIRNALPLLGEGRFGVVNADIWTDYPFENLRHAPQGPAHIVLVRNPPQHERGDFSLAGKSVGNSERSRLTFSGIGIYAPQFFTGHPPGPLALGPLLREAATLGNVTGEHYTGEWQDIGTPERLEALNASLLRRC